jgi:hypothetical protein
MNDYYKRQRRKNRPRESGRARPEPDTLTHGEELFALEYLLSREQGQRSRSVSRIAPGLPERCRSRRRRRADAEDR